MLPDDTHTPGTRAPALGTGQSWLVPALVFACALTLRLLITSQLRKASPLFAHPVVDAWRYDWLARELIRLGEWPEPGAFFQPPAYPLFLAAVYAIFGESYTWARVIQAVLGSMSCLFICLLACRLFSRKVGLTAGLITALYGPLIYFELDLLAPVLIVFWSTLGLLLFHLATENNRRWFYAGAGLSLGMAVAAWPIVGLFAASLLAVTSWRLRRIPGRAFSIALPLGCGLLVPLLPFFTHNILHGEWALISTNGGINFFIGNNPGWQETVAMRPGYRWERIVTLPYRLYGVEQVNVHGSSALFFRESLNFISSQPLSYLQNQLTKVYQLTAGYEIMRNTDLYFFKRYSPVLDTLTFSTSWLKFPFGLLFPLAAVGMIFPARPESRKARYLLVYVLSISLGLLLFFVTSRYRVVLVPALSIFAALGMGVLAEAIRRRSHFLAPTAVLLALSIIVNIDLFGQQQHFAGPVYQAQAPYTLGRISLEQEKPAAALRWLAESVRIDPAYPDVWVDIGRAHFARGHPNRAAEAMQQAIAVAPDYPLPYYNLALIHDRPGIPPDRAVNYYQEFLERSEAYFESFIRGSGRQQHARERVASLTATMGKEE